MLKKVFLMMVVLLAGTQDSFGEAIWTNPITGTNPNTANPYTFGQSVAGGLTVDGIGRGMGISGAAANDRYNASSWNTLALDTNAFFTFSMAPNGGNQLNFTDFQVTLQRSNSSIANYEFRSSLDSFTSNIGAISYPGSGIAATSQTVSLVSSTFQGIQGNVEFRLFAWGAGTSANTLSVNDFAFTGSVTAVPEPTSIALVSLMCCTGFVAAFRRRIAKSKIA